MKTKMESELDRFLFKGQLGPNLCMTARDRISTWG